VLLEQTRRWGRRPCLSCKRLTNQHLLGDVTELRLPAVWTVKHTSGNSASTLCLTQWPHRAWLISHQTCCMPFAFASTMHSSPFHTQAPSWRVSMRKHSNMSTLLTMQCMQQTKTPTCFSNRVNRVPHPVWGSTQCVASLACYHNVHYRILDPCSAAPPPPPLSHFRSAALSSRVGNTGAVLFSALPAHRISHAEQQTSVLFIHLAPIY